MMNVVWTDTNKLYLDMNNHREARRDELTGIRTFRTSVDE